MDTRAYLPAANIDFALFLKAAALTAAVLLLIFRYPVAEAAVPRCDLTVTIEPGKHALHGRAAVTIPQGISAHIGPGACTITSCTVNGEPFTIPGELSPETASSAEITFTSVFLPPGDLSSRDHSNPAPSRVIDTSSLVLLADWHPVIDVPAVYSLTVELPDDFEAVSENTETNVSMHDGFKTVRFVFPHPRRGATLVAGNYAVRTDRSGDTAVRTYLFTDDPQLASTYLKHAKQYIEQYERMLGPFPYPSFSIVENRYQTGHSLPGYTLLGSRVMRLPFIVTTSLGHEVLHQWFGCLVSVDYAAGNWAEGLTSYLADHWYQLSADNGTAYRKKILTDYMNYVLPDREEPLAAFRGPVDYASRSIGYGKGAMVFHMLKKQLGDDVFFRALQAFIAENSHREASWSDIQDTFSFYSGSELQHYFTQWLTRKGTPSLTIGNTKVVFREGAYELSFDITQPPPLPYTLNVPVLVKAPDADWSGMVRVEAETTSVVTRHAARPTSIHIDPGYDLMRSLAPEEKPPVISSFTGNPKSLVVVPVEDRDRYEPAEKYFRRRGYTITDDRSVTRGQLAGCSFMLLSTKNRVYRRLFAGVPHTAGGVTVTTHPNPLNDRHTAVILTATDKDALGASVHKIIRYGNYSRLIFKHSTAVETSVAASQNGIVHDLSPSVSGLEPKKSFGLDRVLKHIHDTPVVFIGEQHDQYAHHVIQLEVIRSLYEHDPALIIGMEMFQQPFQKYLDQYIAAAIDERTFLKKTQYFTRWKFDYNMYRDILQFARAQRIPVIALNLREEIIKKVSSQGIDALTDEDYAEVPRLIDMTNREYRRHMRRLYGYHPATAAFENFFQAQILWDETMAKNAARALERFTGSRMAILAGNGHLQHAWGIPERLERLTGLDHVIILNSTGQRIERELADFVLFPEPITTPSSPHLMVMIEEIDGQEGLTVSGVMPEGPAARAGIKKGDVITALNGRRILDSADLKIELLGYTAGDTIELTVQRKNMLFGTKTIAATVTF